MPSVSLSIENLKGSIIGDGSTSGSGSTILVADPDLAKKFLADHKRVLSRGNVGQNVLKNVSF